MASNNETRKPRMRVMMPREVFHFTMPKPEEYEHMDEDVISESDDDFSSSSVHSIRDSCVTYETEHDHEIYGPQSDNLSSTHHQDHDHEYDEIHGPEPLSPPRCAAHFDCKLCSKMATEPVVTPCGHLYCRDCLDKWLHFFTSHMECPVCHSKVFDSSIVPIKPTPVCNRDQSYGFNVPPPTPKGGLCFRRTFN
ncbi:unnamed protein product [Prunus armeniaca]|uniref:E3 ubiquitin-protein ligase RMA n=1 Tax=Prunus armeniaca TaxID=36596 RepID=A0A6J5Y5N8_PRUAR|nr:unnamed protein product [Prunus armeniaca]CAB4319743.1 unnamed protein product [Prunus armeniaca]